MSKGTITQFPVVHDIGASLVPAKFTVDAQQIKIGTIPGGSVIKVTTSNISTALSPTSLSLAQVEIGTVANPSLFLAGTTTDAFSVGMYSSNAGRGLLTTDTDVYVRLSKNTMAALPTTGAFQVFVEYYPPNQNKNLGTTFDT